MKKIIVVLAVLVFCTGLHAQEWKDSVHIKQKILSAYHENGQVYFNTKKGWGLYDLAQKKLVVEPLYQFLQMSGSELNPGIFFVLNNKVGFMKTDGTVIEKAQYIRYGVAESEECLIKNNGLYATDSIGNFKKKYPSLYNMTEHSVAVYNGLVFVNQYTMGELKLAEYVLPDGSMADSVDASGNAVYLETLPNSNSGVFELKSNSWLVEKGRTDKVAYCKGNILQLKKELAAGKVNSNYVVLNIADNSQHTFKNPANGAANSKLVANVLSGYQPGYMYNVDTTSESSPVIFESGGKYGLYYPNAFRVDIEPGEYDFVYAADKSDRALTVKNGKVGLMELSTGKILYDNLYESLSYEDLHFDWVPTEYVFCNEIAYERDPQSESKDVLPFNIIDEGRSKVHLRKGLEVYNNKMVIHDVDPGVVREIYSDDAPAGSSETVLRNCRSGVFDPASHKWIVPQKYAVIAPGEKGYTCLDNCDESFFYTFYSKEGKPQFENLRFDSLLRNNGAQQQIMQVPGGGKWKINSTASYVYRYIVNANGHWGIFDFSSLNWKVPAVHQYLAQNAIANYYTVVDSGKVGMLLKDYRVMIPSLYKNIRFLPNQNLLCANDTFLFLPDSVHLVGLADTTKNLDVYYDATINQYALNIELVNNKLYTEEEFYDRDNQVYNEDQVSQLGTFEQSHSNVADINSGEEIDFDKGWMICEWDKGFLTRDANEVVRSYDAAGKNPVEVYSDTTSAGCNGQWFWYNQPDKAFAYDKKGTIVQPTKVEEVYFKHDYQPVGYAYHYFDGNKYLDIPRDFTLMCVGNTGNMLGYVVGRDSKGIFRKTYKYYDPATKIFSNTELELTDSPMKVFPVKDGFVLFGQDLSTGLYNCLVLDTDLKTVKSTFKKLTKYEVPKAYGLINAIPYYVLYTDKKIVYFDRHFQFLHECNYQDQPVRSLQLNRIILKSKFKTIVMDWKGHLLKQ